MVALSSDGNNFLQKVHKSAASVISFRGKKSYLTFQIGTSSVKMLKIQDKDRITNITGAGIEPLPPNAGKRGRSVFTGDVPIESQSLATLFSQEADLDKEQSKELKVGNTIAQDQEPVRRVVTLAAEQFLEANNRRPFRDALYQSRHGAAYWDSGCSTKPTGRFNGSD